MAVSESASKTHTLKTSLRAFEIDPATWEHAALGCPSWRNHSFRGTVIAEEKSTAEAERKLLSKS